MAGHVCYIFVCLVVRFNELNVNYCLTMIGTVKLG